MRLALEKRLGVVLSVNSPWVDWLVESAAHLLSRGEVGHNGRTVCERLKGGKHIRLAWVWRERPLEGAPCRRSLGQVRHHVKGRGLIVGTA